MSVSFRSVFIYGLKKGSRLGSGPGLAERAPLSDKGTARSHLARVKIRRRKSGSKISTNAWRESWDRGIPRCNITTVRSRKKARRTDWSGLERTSQSRHFRRLYLAEPIVILLFGPWNQYQLNNTKNGVLIKSTHGAKDKVNKVIYRPFHILIIV